MKVDTRGFVPLGTDPQNRTPEFGTRWDHERHMADLGEGNRAAARQKQAEHEAGTEAKERAEREQRKPPAAKKAKQGPVVAEGAEFVDSEDESKVYVVARRDWKRRRVYTKGRTEAWSWAYVVRKIKARVAA